MDRLLSMRTFVRVVDAGSFAGAARQLDLNQAVVTRLVADLEQHLGARLLHRTTRSMQLTEAGAGYLSHCRSILAEIDAAEAGVARGQEHRAGRVRLALPLLFGTDVLPARLLEFRRRYPDIVLDVSLLDRPVDLVNEGFDMAVVSSLHQPAAGTSIFRELFTMPFSLCASAAYLQAHPAPATPAGLAAHDCIGVYHSLLGENWTLTSERGEHATVPVHVVLWASDVRLIRESVRSGIGIGVMSQRAIAADQAAGLLVPVLPGWKLGELRFALIYPGREFVPARVRAVIDFILEGTREEAGSLPLL
ncbi:MAG: LysR family transcriptional regulator [Paucimonas sp.]|nr:LysR family transcriptional regulator [Paucimonas sp.]